MEIPYRWWCLGRARRWRWSSPAFRPSRTCTSHTRRSWEEIIRSFSASSVNWDGSDQPNILTFMCASAMPIAQVQRIKLQKREDASENVKLSEIYCAILVYRVTAQNGPSGTVLIWDHFVQSPCTSSKNSQPCWLLPIGRLDIFHGPTNILSWATTNAIFWLDCPTYF